MTARNGEPLLDEELTRSIIGAFYTVYRILGFGFLEHVYAPVLVDDRVIVELKASERLHPIAERQLYDYLRCTKLEVGLLLHFGHEPKFYRLVHSRRHKTQLPEQFRR